MKKIHNPAIRILKLKFFNVKANELSSYKM